VRSNFQLWNHEGHEETDLSAEARSAKAEGREERSHDAENRVGWELGVRVSVNMATWLTTAPLLLLKYRSATRADERSPA
jgi:hypothetical protein